MKKYLFCISLIVTISTAKASKLRDVEWKEISNKEGISVFQAVKFKHNSGIVPIRFKAVLNHDIVRVLSVLADEKRKPEWLPSLNKIKVLEKISSRDITVYYRYDAPWPFKDRDFVIQNLGTFDSNDLKVSVDIKSIKRHDDPADGSTVRGTTYDGYSIIRPMGKNKTMVEMAFMNDFGGVIPKFIVNFVQKSWPYEFMKQLRVHLRKSDIALSPEFQNNSAWLKYSGKGQTL
jgi:hypothetical protein